MQRLSKLLGAKRPISRYREQKVAQMAYFRKMKNTFRETPWRRSSIVYFLEKGTGQLQGILDIHQDNVMELKDFARLTVVKNILEQQRFLLTNPLAALKDRIVSLHKPYVKPIVRGKENKPVEFGVKAYILRVDGLTFINKLDFIAFNECTRLKFSVAKDRSFFCPA